MLIHSVVPPLSGLISLSRGFVSLICRLSSIVFSIDFADEVMFLLLSLCQI